MSIEAVTCSYKAERRQFVILTRHFFHRLFRNDIVDFEDQMMERVVGLLALLAIFCGRLSYEFLKKYLWIPDEGTSWVEKCAFITFCMFVMGLIAALEWDILFPDARDYKNLTIIPLKTRTLFGAKFSSLCLFVGLFALSMVSASSLVFTSLLAHWQSSSPLFILNYLLVHMLCVFLASFFALFFNILIVGIFMALLGHRLFSRFSSYIKSFLLIAHFFLIVLYMRLLLFGIRSLASDEIVKGSLPFIRNFMNYFPPMWFTDLYETLLGSRALPYHGAFKFGLSGLSLMIAAFFLTAGLSYRRFLHMQGTFQTKKNVLKKLADAFSRGYDRIFLRNSVQRAVFHFYSQTIKTSLSLKMRLASYLALGIGLSLIIIIPGFEDPKSFFRINQTLLSIPLILSFFLLLGVRSIVNIPVSLRGNWIFQLTEQKDIRHYFAGLRKAVLTLNLLPLFGVLFVFFCFLWKAPTAFLHCLFSLAVSILVMEVFFLNFNKIPFACTYLPGKEKIQLFWIIYLFAFWAYISLMSRVEFRILKAPRSLFIFIGIAFFSILSIRIYQYLYFYKKNGMKYEEVPEPLIIGFDYEIPRHKRKLADNK
jgi:hypothetical protein